MSEERPRRRRKMSGTDRDLAAIKRRAESRSDRQLDDLEAAVSDLEGDLDFGDEGVTAPIALLSRDLNERERGIVEQLREASGGTLDEHAPVTLEHFVKLLARVNEVKLEERANHKEQADRLLEAMGRRPPADELKTIKWKVNIIWGLLVAAVVAAGGSAMTVAKYLRESGGNDRAHEIRHETLDRAIADHERRVRDAELQVMKNAQRIEDHLTGHRPRGSDAPWAPALTVPPATQPRTQR